MKSIVIGIAVAIITLVPGFSAFGGSTLKINYANVDVDTQTLRLQGINFDAFDIPTVTIGDTILADVCTITTEIIECDLSGTPAFSTGTWTVYVSAGNAPRTNDEIDVFIPLGQTVQICSFGDFVQCYSADSATQNVGQCQPGIRTCSTSGTWGICVGEIVPIDEICDDELDNDCDGVIDNGCAPPTECNPGETVECYSGPAGSLGSGQCSSGVMICSDIGVWGSCSGEILPEVEICDGVDNDCDGLTDEGGMCSN